MWGVPDQHSDEQTAEVNIVSTSKIEVTKTLHSSRHRQELPQLLANIHK